MLDLQKLSLAINNTFEVLPAPGLLLLSDDGNKKNLITIGWLQFGNLWGKWTVNVFIRQSRHSFKILNNQKFVIPINIALISGNTSYPKSFFKIFQYL